MPKKECFGQLANMTVRFNTSTEQHFLRVDKDKLKECDGCNLFNKCMFLKYNDLFQELLDLIDVGGKEAHQKIGRGGSPSL